MQHHKMICLNLFTFKNLNISNTCNQSLSICSNVNIVDLLEVSRLLVEELTQRGHHEAFVGHQHWGGGLTGLGQQGVSSLQSIEIFFILS